MSVKGHLKAAENLIGECDDDDDVQETFCCKYCTFETSNVEDLDEHIITHEEAILEDNGEEETEATISNGDMTSSTFNNSISSTPLKDSDEPRDQANAYILSNESASKIPNQLLPAFYQQYADREDKKVFVCPYCGYQTMKYFDLNQHLKDHSEPVYACSECPYTCKRKHDINKHLLVHCGNATGPIFKCNKCPYRTYRKDHLTKHLLCHGNDECEGSVFKCNQCQYATIRREHLTRHLLGHEHDITAIEPMFKCDNCPYKTNRKDHFTRHLLCHDVNHSGSVFKCNQCHYATIRREHLTRHLLGHEHNITAIEPMFKCDNCPYKTNRKDNFTRHLLCHDVNHSVPMFKCNSCPYGTNRKDHLTKHIRRHGNEVVYPKSDFVYSCTECGYTSRRLSDLHRHAVLHCDVSVKGVFKCTKCDYASGAGNPFAKHVLSHCKVKEMPAPVFLNVDEYDEEEQLHPSGLETNNIASVKVLENQLECTSSKKANIESYKNTISEQSEPRNIDHESENCKVVVLTGFATNKVNANG